MHNGALIKKNHRRAVLAHGLHIVRHEQYGGSLPQQLGHMCMALLLKKNVTYGQGFINNEDIRIQAGLHGKGKTNKHAAGIRLDRLIEEIAYIREFAYLLKPLRYFGCREPQGRAVDEDILAPREFRQKTAAQLKQRGHPPTQAGFTHGGPKRPGQNLQQRTFARAVMPHNTERLTLAHREGHIAQRPELTAILTPQQCLLESVSRPEKDIVALAEAGCGDDHIWIIPHKRINGDAL